MLQSYISINVYGQSIIFFKFDYLAAIWYIFLRNAPGDVRLPDLLCSHTLQGLKKIMSLMSIPGVT